MENASKALIIAGAILISILIISLGILVYSNAKTTADTTAQLDSEEAQVFNSKISDYCGKGKTATDMNTLVNVISSLNGKQNGAAEKHWIKLIVDNSIDDTYYTGDDEIDPESTSGSGSLKYPSFSTGISYKAVYTTSSSTGYVNSVTISKDS